jgi:hypothetical protein
MSMSSTKPSVAGRNKMLAGLGALIVPIGIGLAVWDASKRGSVAPGGACEDDEHCRPGGNCLNLGPDETLCAEMCSVGCDDGFRCVALPTQLKNASGFHDLGEVYFCLPESVATRFEPEKVEPPPPPPPEPEPEVEPEPDSESEVEATAPADDKATKKKKKKKRKRKKKKKKRGSGMRVIGIH